MEKQRQPAPSQDWISDTAYGKTLLKGGLPGPGVTKVEVSMYFRSPRTAAAQMGAAPSYMQRSQDSLSKTKEKDSGNLNLLWKQTQKYPSFSSAIWVWFHSHEHHV